MRSLILPIICVIALQQSSCNSNSKDSTVTQSPIKISDQGVNIAYSDTGKGDTTLLFVHGWGINRSYWSNQVNFFSKKYRVVTIDLPGFGESGKNRAVWNTEAYGKDMDSVITQLNLKNVVVVGHSMAGHIILQAAINEPVKVIGMVGVDNFKGVGHIETPEDKKGYAVAMNELKHHFKQFATQWFNQQLFYKTTADTIKKRILNDITKADSVIAVAAIDDDGFDEAKKLAASKKKLYLINSDYTSTDTTGLKSNHIPFKVYYIHATGHFPMVEKPKEFNTALSDILTKL
ncbi:MAG: Pimeloyl-ACP methyl ester carboxylesterase [Mucilaginibacter sp.]|nr:Pimeloyl-ACP methyl ester carboxylesterase [Mucilaginibacter sp.]